jgi:GNAT superfamily N-acetyltransferase
VIVRLLKCGDHALNDIERILNDIHGNSVYTPGWGPDEEAVIFGGFLEDALVSFGVLCDYSHPRFHVGRHVDHEHFLNFLREEEVGLYQIVMLHADEKTVHLHEVAGILIEAIEQWLSERFHRYCLFITLKLHADKSDFPVYERLGFKKTGSSAELMCFDLNGIKRPKKNRPALPENLTVRFLDDGKKEDDRAISECYRRVFFDGQVHDQYQVASMIVNGLTNAPDFAPHLSLLLLQCLDQQAVGFMLAEQTDSQSMHISVVGLLPELRGQWLPYRCFPLIAERARSYGIHRVTFVSSQHSVARMAMKVFSARELDKMQTIVKMG